MGLVLRFPTPLAFKDAPMRTLVSTLALAAVTVTMAGCSDAESSTSAQQETTASSSPSQEAPATSTTTTRPKPTLAKETTAQPTSKETERPAQPQHGASVSVNSGQVGGHCGTASNGISIRANDSTSCEFAAIIFDRAMAATYHWTDNPGVTSIPVTELVGVPSPVTGQLYNLECILGSDQRTLSCRGLDSDAGVFFENPPSPWKQIITIAG